MKNRIPFLAIILGVVLVVIAVVLPSGSDDAEFVRLAKMLPEELGEFTYIDMSVLQSDEGLQSVWESMKGGFLGEDIYGENVSDITGFGMAGSEDDSVMLYSGDFNLSRMESVIEESSIESFQYEGVTVWTDAYSYSTAIIDDMVFIGSRDNIELCIDLVGGKSASLYSNKDAQDVIGRLTGGYMLGLLIVDDESSAETYGMLAVGMAWARQGGNISQMSLLKFEDVDAAQDYVTLFGSVITEDYDIVQDGQYLTITAASEIPSQEETVYNSVYDDLDYAIYAYYSSNEGALPTIDGTVNIDGYDCQILDICAILISAGGILNEMPEGVASIDGPDNDNCDSGCTGCSAESHYIWAIDDYGLYSTCVGEDCDANGESGFQGVWP